MSVPYDSDIEFSTSKEYDGVFIFNSASLSSGAYMQRTRKLGLDEAVYSKLKEHKTARNVKEGAANHMIMKGAVKQIYTWEDSENITQDDLTTFWNLAKSKSIGINMQLVESDAVARRLVISASFENTSNSWLDYPLPYVLDCSTSRMEITSDDTDLICYVFSNNDPELWTKQHCNIANGETLTITKEGDDYCYVIFGEQVTKGSQTLEALKPYRLTSNSISVTNNSGNSCKVFRVYK